MLTQNMILSYYKRKDIQKAMVESALNREVAIKYSDRGFGKRPDVLKYPDEILDLAKQGATSFHASEELWENPQLISAAMKKNDVEKLKRGWDLVLDIDSPYWKIAKITAWLIIKGLKEHGIQGISVKFSGNKGFHIGVAFEAFPHEYQGKITKNFFPDAARNIASFLIDYITEEHIKVRGNNEIIFGEGFERKFKISYQDLQDMTGKRIDELTVKICSKCKNRIEKEKEEKYYEFHCPKCGSSIKTGEELQFQKCKKCWVLMQKIESKRNLCGCGSDDYFIKFNPSAIIEVDTILISSRHLFRMPYSLHEKTGLVSTPFNPEKILEFEKKFANPEIAKVSRHKFIDREKTRRGEAKKLFENAMRCAENREKKDIQEKSSTAFETLREAVPEVLFPPCIKKMLNGMEDGKKRAIFILINFLKCVGWDYDKIESRIIDWNKKNPEPLKETIVQGQLRYHKRNAEKILPPNCSNKMYYIDMQMCMPDNFCKKIKNPVNYAILKGKMENK